MSDFNTQIKPTFQNKHVGKKGRISNKELLLRIFVMKEKYPLEVAVVYNILANT